MLYSIEVAASGNPVVFGRFNGTTNFGCGPIASAGQNDLFLVELDSAGAPLSVRTFGGTGSQPNTTAPLPEGAGLAVGDNGNLFITSTTNGPIKLGGGVLTGTNGFFVASFSP